MSIVYAIIVLVLGVLLSILNCVTVFYDFDDDKMKNRLIWFLICIYIKTWIFEAICLMISGIMIIIKSRNLARSEQNKFNEEKRWFWSILSLFGILITTMIAEQFHGSPEMLKSLTLSIVLDLIKLFGAVNIFLIFIAREKVKNLLFKRYYGVYET